MGISKHHFEGADEGVRVQPGPDLGAGSNVLELHADGAADGQAQADTPADIFLGVIAGNSIYGGATAAVVAETGGEPQARAEGVNQVGINVKNGSCSSRWPL